MTFNSVTILKSIRDNDMLVSVGVFVSIAESKEMLFLPPKRIPNKLEVNRKDGLTSEGQRMRE